MQTCVSLREVETFQSKVGQHSQHYLVSSPSEPETTPKSDRPTWVIGHRNPDTDAICSAIAYADLLRQTRIPNAEAACCGPPNQRTEWVLSQAEISRPKLIPDVYLRAEDICRCEVATAKVTDTVIEAYRQMTSLSFRSLPVADENGSIVGMLALQDCLLYTSDAADEE